MRRLNFLVILPMLVALWDCPGPTPPPPTPKAAVLADVWGSGQKVPGATVTLDAPVGQPKPTTTTNAEGNAVFTGLPTGATHIWVTAKEFVDWNQHLDLVEGDNRVTVTLTPQHPPARPGVVRLDNRVMTDDAGPSIPLGASLFWAVWGYQNDKTRLEQTLDYLKHHGVDYVRVLAAVGPSGAWEDRMADPTSPQWPAAIAGVTDLVYQYGLRIEWTIFGGLDKTPTVASRRKVVDDIIAMSKGREKKIMFWEVANEAASNGWSDKVSELASLTKYLRTKTPSITIAAPTCGKTGCDQTFYTDADATIRTAHLSRSQGGEGGVWRPVRQPWEMLLCQAPKPWTNNEPIGPGSSVASDDDPLRLTMTLVTTAISGGATYVYHSRPGIRGGGRGDMVRGGPADWWEVKNVEKTFAGLNAVRKVLPPKLANWKQHNCNSHFPDRPFVCDDATQLRTYCATSGQDVICAPLLIEGSTRYVARRAIVGSWIDALTGATLSKFSLAAGESVTLTGRPAGIIKATWK